VSVCLWCLNTGTALRFTINVIFKLVAYLNGTYLQILLRLGGERPIRVEEWGGDGQANRKFPYRETEQGAGLGERESALFGVDWVVDAK
jgi:hypothetical protein